MSENKTVEYETAAQNPVAISEKYGFKKLFCAEKAKRIPAQTSMRITVLRFLLIVLVVFIHNNFKAEEILKGALEYGYTPFAYENGLFGRWIQIFISDGIARCAVPLFFMFASYLQFMKGDSYGVLLKVARGSVFSVAASEYRNLRRIKASDSGCFSCDD